MGRGGSDGGGTITANMVRQAATAYFYVAIWIGLSFSVIIYNKYILDAKLYNFPFPISLTMLHMGFCSSLAFFLVHVVRLVELPTMTREMYVSSVVPIGALYSLTLWFGNAAYMYLSVSFIQMLKALMPVAVYTMGMVLKQDDYSPSTMANMVFITMGVAIAAYGELSFNLIGCVYQLASVASESTRLVLVQILLGSRGIQLNPITSLYYVAPACLGFLSIPFLLVELPRLWELPSWSPDLVVFVPNLLCAFLLNLAVFLLIGKTSALTMNVAGVVKDWILIAFSWHVIKDKVSVINLLGYGLAFLGVAWYNHSKFQSALQAKAQAKSSQVESAESQEEGKSLLEKGVEMLSPKSSNSKD